MKRSFNDIMILELITLDYWPLPSGATSAGSLANCIDRCHSSSIRILDTHIIWLFWIRMSISFGGTNHLAASIRLSWAYNEQYSHLMNQVHAVQMTLIYILNLAPEVSNGVFIGTVAMVGLILHFVRKLNLSWTMSILFIILGYVLQDLSHLATGEKTFQSTYSNGGSIDLSQPVQWMRLFTEHVYFLIPLVVHITIPFLPNSSILKLYSTYANICLFGCPIYDPCRWLVLPWLP